VLGSHLPDFPGLEFSLLNQHTDGASVEEMNVITLKSAKKTTQNTARRHDA
jgi:hypothetical protein